jgi:hypothetical protein
MPLAAGTKTVIVPEPPATVLTYEQSAQLMTDMVFRGRVKVSVLNFATKILYEPALTQGHTSRYRWAQRAYQQPDQVASESQQPTVMHPNVQTAGSEITDGNLQVAVEAVVGELM